MAATIPASVQKIKADRKAELAAEAQRRADEQRRREREDREQREAAILATLDAAGCIELIDPSLRGSTVLDGTWEKLPVCVVTFVVPGHAPVQLALINNGARSGFADWRPASSMTAGEMKTWRVYDQSFDILADALIAAENFGRTEGSDGSDTTADISR